MSLGVVAFAMREVRRPENAARVTEALSEPDAAPFKANAEAVVESPTPSRLRDSFQDVSISKSANAGANVSERTTFQAADLAEVLSIAGWTPERFGRFEENEPLTDAERKELVQLLWRVRTFDTASMESWAKEGPSMDELRASPVVEHRGQMVGVAGRIIALSRHKFSSHDAARLEMPGYYTCVMEINNNGGRALVFALDVPIAWGKFDPGNEPVAVNGLYVKHVPAEDADSPNDDAIPLVVSKRIAWHPAVAREPMVSFGKSVLGSLGVDVGVFDDIRGRGPIRSAEREAFYQTLGAVDGIGANQLARFAQSNLDRFGQQWRSELAAKDQMRRRLAQEVIRRADEGRYSVAPLFNDAKRQIGQLFVFDGAARRVVRIDVGSRSDGKGSSDVVQRLGVDHYYELEVFTDDSQNYPLVFCVRELPKGFPTGEGLHVPVRIAGFFIKAWRYTTRGARDSETGDIVAGAGRPQYAPLLIGRAPLVLRLESADSDAARLVGGGLFLLALGGIWAAAWWFARDDRKFAETTRSAGFSLPPGETLNDLNLVATSEPIKIPGAEQGLEMNDEG